MSTHTHLASAILQELEVEHMTQSQLGAKAGLTQGAISQLISHGFRAAPSTLKRITHGWPKTVTGIKILVAHLRDEIHRAGHQATDFEIRVKDTLITSIPSKSDEDLAFIRKTGEHVPVLRALIHDLSELTQEELISQAPKALAAESEDAYKTTR